MKFKVKSVLVGLTTLAIAAVSTVSLALKFKVFAQQPSEAAKPVATCENNVDVKNECFHKVKLAFAVNKNQNSSKKLKVNVVTDNETITNTELKLVNEDKNYNFFEFSFQVPLNVNLSNAVVTVTDENGNVVCEPIKPNELEQGDLKIGEKKIGEKIGERIIIYLPQDVSNSNYFNVVFLDKNNQEILTKKCAVETVNSQKRIKIDFIDCNTSILEIKDMKIMDENGVELDKNKFAPLNFDIAKKILEKA